MEYSRRDGSLSLDSNSEMLDLGIGLISGFIFILSLTTHTMYFTLVVYNHTYDEILYRGVGRGVSMGFQNPIQR